MKIVCDKFRYVINYFDADASMWGSVVDMSVHSYCVELSVTHE